MPTLSRSLPLVTAMSWETVSPLPSLARAYPRTSERLDLVGTGAGNASGVANAACAHLLTSAYDGIALWDQHGSAGEKKRIEKATEGDLSIKMSAQAARLLLAILRRNLACLLQNAECCEFAGSACCSGSKNTATITDHVKVGAGGHTEIIKPPSCPRKPS